MPLVYPAQAIPGDYCIGDVVFSLISFSGKHGSFEPGAKGTVVGPADNNRDTKLLAKFEGFGNTINMLLPKISRADPNNVSGDCCMVAALCLLGRLVTRCCMISKWRSEPASAPRSFLDRRCHYSVHTLKAM